MPEKILVFLGAGASAPFNIPTSTGLVSSVKANLPAYKDRINEIKNKVVEFKSVLGVEPTFDIEALFAVLDFWSYPKERLESIGPSLAEILDPTACQVMKNRRDAKLAIRIKEHIVRKCFIIDPIVKDRIYVTYGRLFNEILNRFNLPNCDPQGKLACPPIDVFTTNYDNVIEQYCDLNGISYYDGYSPGYNGKFEFDIRSYSKETTLLRLYKLHGTVTYGYIDNGSTIKRFSYMPPKGRLMIDGDLAFPDLIFPVTHEYGTREPQFELLHCLKEKLLESEICIAIGYRFRDVVVSQIFKDACRRNQKITVYLVSLDAKETIQKQKFDPNRFKAIDKEIECISIADDIL